MMKSIKIDRKLAEKILDIAKKVNNKTLAKRLILVAQKSNHLTSLKNLIFSIQEQEAKEEGKKLLILTFAQPVSQRTEELVVKAICQEFLLQPSDLYIIRRYSKRLKAGFQGRLGDYILDLSLANNLNKLQEVFKNGKILTNLA